VVIFIAVAAFAAVGVRPIASHNHDGGNGTHSHLAELNFEHVHAQHQRHVRSHAHVHPHAHNMADHAHDHHFRQSTATTKTSLVASQPHTHYVIFGFEFTVTGIDELRKIIRPGLGLDTTGLPSVLVQILDIRCPLPPDRFVTEFTLTWSSSSTLNSIVAGRDKDLPVLPPPEFVSA
jgi:hypothetical protein